MSRRRKGKPGPRNPVAAILEPYANHLRKLAITYRLTDHGKWEGLITAAEVLDEGRALNLDVPEVDAEAVARLERAVSLLREAGELLREVGADVASALAVAGGAGAGAPPLPSRTWISKAEEPRAAASPPSPPPAPTDITDPRGLLESPVHVVPPDKVFKGGSLSLTVNGYRADRLVPNEPLGRADRALLAVLAQRSPQPTSRVQLAILSGYSSSSSSFANALGKLRRLKLAGSEGPMIFATTDGLSAAPDVGPMPKGDELRRYWLARCNRAEQAVLSVLIDTYPHAVDRDELARRARYSSTSSSFANALGKLRTLELVRGLKASAELMEDA
jgi:hypothetical protein